MLLLKNKVVGTVFAVIYLHSTFFHQNIFTMDNEAKKPDESKAPKAPKPKPGEVLMVHQTRKAKGGSRLCRSVAPNNVKGFERNGFVLLEKTAEKNG